MPISWIFSHAQAKQDSRKSLSHLGCKQTEVIINHAGLRGFLPALPALLAASDSGLFKVDLPREREGRRVGWTHLEEGRELSGSVALCSDSVCGGKISV